MYWLVKTNSDQLEVWSEAEYKTRLMKCEYYGARPFWRLIRKLMPPDSSTRSSLEIGEIVPYHSTKLGKKFAVIIEFFLDGGQRKFKGIDISTNHKIVAPVNHLA